MRRQDQQPAGPLQTLQPGAYPSEKVVCQEPLMRYVLKQDLFAWGDDFNIFDEQGTEVYFVDGAGIALRNQLSFQDMQKQELAYIAQTMFSWGTEYTVSRGGKTEAKISQQTVSGNRCNFFIDVPGPHDLCAEGDFYNHNYVFKRDEAVVASSSKEPNSQGFGVDIPANEDPVLILASSIVIDLVTRDSGSRGSLYK
jgi:uncharacterized protein YxjI